ncbi:vascular-related unknown protein 4-like [Apium graveolens]|uniref:vascular-related unknown protein 4-like n=1 Tax=Apium graveolens TaxID=4045 RepID=UPI003D78FE01
MDTFFASKETICDDQDSEESGWTSYFDDFFSNQKQEQYSGDSNDNNILVSDAASFVVDHVKFHQTGQQIPSTSIMPKFSKKLDLKRPSTNEKFLHDGSLDDTASSPVNSPRIVQEEEAIPDLPLDQGSDERTCEIVMEGEKNDCTNMRKRGLSLFSMPKILNVFC